MAIKSLGEITDKENIYEILIEKDKDMLCNALSYFISGDLSLTKKLNKGSKEEIAEAQKDSDNDGKNEKSSEKKGSENSVSDTASSNNNAGSSGSSENTPAPAPPPQKVWVPPVYQTIHHDAVYNTVKVVVCNYCGAEFGSAGEFQVHKDANGG